MQTYSILVLASDTKTAITHGTVRTPNGPVYAAESAAKMLDGLAIHGVARRDSPSSAVASGRYAGLDVTVYADRI